MHGRNRPWTVNFRRVREREAEKGKGRRKTCYVVTVPCRQPQPCVRSSAQSAQKWPASKEIKHAAAVSESLMTGCRTSSDDLPCILLGELASKPISDPYTPSTYISLPRRSSVIPLPPPRRALSPSLFCPVISAFSSSTAFKLPLTR